MTACTRLSDRMPLVALGRLNWTLEEDRHLRECADCHAEWEVVWSGAHLGNSPAASVNSSGVTLAVLERLEHDTRRRRRAWKYAGLGVAAALVGMFWSRPPGHPPATAPAQGVTSAALQIPLPELDGLQPEELDSVLQAIDAGDLEPSALNGPNPGDVESEDLESVLDYWEG
jgi:hypothetical protein